MLDCTRRLNTQLFGLRRFVFCSVFLLSFKISLAASLDEYLNDHVYAKAEASFYGGYQLVNPVVDRPLRLLGSVWATLNYDPTDYLSLQINAFGRWPVDIGWANGTQFQPVSYFDHAYVQLSDSFLKINLNQASLSLGYLVIPWSSTRGAQVLNRLNSVNYNRGPDFTSTVLGYMPQWGIYFQTSVKETSIDLAFSLKYSPSTGNWVASEQGGVQIGRYQGALAPRLFPTWDMGEDFLFYEDFWDLKKLWAPAMALKLKRNLSDVIDASLLFYWGFSEVPWIEDLRGRKPFVYQRMLGLGFDFSANLGVAILKGEFLVEPRFSDWGGKTTILTSALNTRSLQLPSLTFAIALDAEYGAQFSGSLELIDTVWFDVPEHEFILGVESLTADDDSPERTVVHRLALAVVTESALFNQWLMLRLKGELGLTQPDILGRISFSHQWEELGLEAGLYSDVFLGIPGSPGWFRREATFFGMFLQHKI